MYACMQAWVDEWEHDIHACMHALIQPYHIYATILVIRLCPSHSSSSIIQWWCGISKYRNDGSNLALFGCRRAIDLDWLSQLLWLALFHPFHSFLPFIPLGSFPTPYPSIALMPPSACTCYQLEYDYWSIIQLVSLSCPFLIPWYVCSFVSTH